MIYKFLIISLFICTGCTGKEEIVFNQGLVIKNATVIFPIDGKVKKNQIVIIEDDSITYVGNELESVNDNFKTIDAKHKYIIPGLIDAHVHVTSTNGLNDELETKYPELVKKFREQLPKSYLYFGFTTLIDLGTTKPERLEEFNNYKIKPDLLYVGGTAAISNGYSMVDFPEEERFEKFPNFLYLESESENIPNKYDPENHSPKAVAKRIKDLGGIALKTHYEPGWNPNAPKMPVPNLDFMDEVISEAHKQKLPVIVHANSLEAHQFCADAGIDMVAHGLWNWGSEKIEEIGKVSRNVKAVLDTEINKEIGYMPSLQVIGGLRSLVDNDFLGDPELRNVLPIEIIDFYKSEEGKWFAEIFKGGDSDELVYNIFTRILYQGQASLKYMSDKKGKILFATDTPSSPTYGNPPGYNGYLELQQMHEAGMSLQEILKSTTISNAKEFGIDNKFGSIEKGKIANIIILEKNPLENISAYNSIEKIIIRGSLIKREVLRAN